MNISKFTQKSIAGCEQTLRRLAYEYGNQEIEQEHLLYASADTGRQSDSQD